MYFYILMYISNVNLCPINVSLKCQTVSTPKQYYVGSLICFSLFEVSVFILFYTLGVRHWCVMNVIRPPFVIKGKINE